MFRRQKLIRSGTALVETAAVISVFLLLMFGIIEYARFIFVRQMVAHAAREGARYAVVNTYMTTVAADAEAVTMQQMQGVNDSVRNFKVKCYAADANGKDIGSPTNVRFGEYVAVQIACDFEPVLPQFLFMGQTIEIHTKALMYSEAN